MTTDSSAPLVRRTATTLADGRDLFYFDDSEPYVSGEQTRRLDDPRPLPGRYEPVVTIGAIAFGGYLFGLLGIMIATPLVVCILVCVNMLYLADRLGEGRHFPTEEKVPEAEANT